MTSSKKRTRHAPITPLSDRQEQAVKVSRILRETGTVTLVVSLITYPVMLLAVNQFEPHLIEQGQHHSGDPYSNVGVLVFTLGALIGLALIAAAIIIYQHVGNRCESRGWQTSKTVIKVLALVPTLAMTSAALFGLTILINGLLR